MGRLNGQANVWPADFMLHLVCLLCNKKKRISIIRMCPKCLSPMEEVDDIDTPGTHKKYLGRHDDSLGITLYHCTNCDFASITSHSHRTKEKKVCNVCGATIKNN